MEPCEKGQHETERPSQSAINCTRAPFSRELVCASDPNSTLLEYALDDEMDKLMHDLTDFQRCSLPLGDVQRDHLQRSFRVCDGMHAWDWLETPTLMTFFFRPLDCLTEVDPHTQVMESLQVNKPICIDTM